MREYLPRAGGGAHVHLDVGAGGLAPSGIAEDVGSRGKSNHEIGLDEDRAVYRGPRQCDEPQVTRSEFWTAEVMAEGIMPRAGTPRRVAPIRVEQERITRVRTASVSSAPALPRTSEPSELVLHGCEDQWATGP